MTLSGIKRLRQEKGWTQKQLSALTGIHQVRLSYLERGLPPEPEETRRLSRALGVEADHGQKTDR